MSELTTALYGKWTPSSGAPWKWLRSTFPASYHLFLQRLPLMIICVSVFFQLGLWCIKNLSPWLLPRQSSAMWISTKTSRKQICRPLQFCWAVVALSRCFLCSSQGIFGVDRPVLESSGAATKQWCPKWDPCPWLSRPAPQPHTKSLLTALGSEDSHLTVLQPLANNNLGLQPQTEASVQCDLACRGFLRGST